MTARPRPHIILLALSVVLCGLFGLTSCTTGPQLSSPVGVWIADGDDSGTLTIRQDGTFSVTDATFNPISSHDTAGDFNASGVWKLVPDDRELSIKFRNAREGDLPVPPGGRFAPFKSGSIRFQDPDNVYDIEFHFVNESPVQ